MPIPSRSGLVYSSDRGRLCPDCSAPVAACSCRRGQSATAATFPDGAIRISRETKGRKGAGVTLVSGVAAHDEGIAALCTKLKRTCGSGGTVKDGVIEIQGDHRAKIAEALKAEGWKVKVIGA